MTTSNKFNKVAANVISWTIITITFIALYFVFSGVAVHASLH
jgi:hypothetical protein